MPHITEPGATTTSAVRGMRWRFGRCGFDGSSLSLSVDDQIVPLEPKPLELLMFLLLHAGEVVTKEELHENIWPGRVLSESVLTKCVARLRSAIGDADQSMIRTVHGYGYRFAAELSVETATPEAPAPALGLQAGDAPPLRPLWHLLRPLGHGGSSEVWLAEHGKTREQRVFKFALGPDQLSALKREITLFRLLQQTYGERRDVVKLLDWNLDDPPYFIETELVAGGTLPDWCEAQGGIAAVPTATRLELIAQAAEALAAAHTAGILHRDLKPANLLIDTSGERPQIKLGDLGCGQTLDAHQLHRLSITRMGFTQALDGSTEGTPLYLSPERLAGQPPTAKSDIYALGVMLYQVLAADWRRPLAPGWERDIDDPLLREDIAAAAASQAAERLGDAAELASNLRHLGERHQRRSHEDAERLEAERLRDSLERSRLRRGWTRALVAVLIIGICATSLSLWRARQERRQAEAAREEARAAVRFLSDDVLAATDPFGGGRPRLSLHGLLDEAAPKLAQQLERFPVARAEIGLAMGRAYEGLGDWTGARHRLETALEEAVGALGEDADLSLTIADRLAYVSLLQSRYDESEQLFDKVYRIRRARHGERHPDTLATRDGMAWLEYERGHYADAAQRYEALIKDYGDTDPVGLTSVRWSLADCDLELNRSAEAEQLMRTVIADSTALQGAHHPRVLWQMTTLGDVLMTQGRYDEAAQIFDQAYAGLVATVGETHPYTLTALHFRGALLLERGDPVAALPLLRRAYENRASIHGEDHVWTRFSANRVGEALIQLGLVSEALPLLQKTYAAAVAAQGPAHPNVLLIVHSYADALIAAGRDDEAESLLLRALADSQQSLPPDNLRIAYLRQSLGELRAQQHRTQDAKREFAAAHAIYVTALGAAHPQTQRAEERPRHL
jgi:DNA-binding winged helix-turn-helix (wHTH) protein/tetratricopeptide (TPR) repeat protein